VEVDMRLEPPTTRLLEGTMQPTTTLTDRLGALSGAAYVLLILVGNQIATGGGGDAHPSGATDLAYFNDAVPASRVVGESMEVLGILVFLFFLGWLAQALRSRSGTAAWLANTATIAGVVTISVKIASVLPLAAGELDGRELSPTMARILTDMNGAGFVITFLPFGVFLFSVGCAILSSGLLGKVAGWTGVVFGALCVLVTLATQTDPVDTNPMPFLAGLVWVLVVSVRLGTKGPRIAPVERVDHALPAHA
jgi:hypothetical protein